MPFPRKFAGRSSMAQPITGKLSQIDLAPEHRELIDQIVTGLFLDMQTKPLRDILAACFITGAHMATEVKRDRQEND